MQYIYYKITIGYTNVLCGRPVPKQGNHELPNNNRPISLLHALSKVCERVAYNQFVTYLTTRERLTTQQSDNKKMVPY